MNHVLCGLAANPALPSELVDRLIVVAAAPAHAGAGPETEADPGADPADLADALACRAGLSRAQAVTLAARAPESAVRLAHEGRLTADDVDPVSQPLVALALLDERAGRPAWARLLAADPVVEHRERLATCAGLPAAVVETLAADEDIRVVTELALWAPSDTAAALASHPHAEVRRAVAANEATPPALLAALITGKGLPAAQACLVCDREEPPFAHPPNCDRLDCDLRPGASCDGSHESTTHDMRLMALRNPSTPAEAVVAFADHPSLLLRWALAARRDLPAEVYEQLLRDPAPGVRAGVAENPAIDQASMRASADDRDAEVRRSLALNPRVPLDLLARLADGTRIGTFLLPRIATASPAEITELARSSVPALRMLLARRRDLPDAVRDALADDADAKVAGSVAPHPGLTEARLRALADRHGARVIAQVASNPDAPPALLTDLARREPPVPKALRRIAGHRRATAEALLACLSDRRARPIAAGHPALPGPVIAELLADDDGQVAEAAAATPSLPISVMAGLIPTP
ncbi:hypothetical protein [Streptomyces silaceus]|uniref:hypothetical protein n=1 Tax=Streptomyces silaceus TaxID=545123 RepID=UPI0006EB591A|nr:hypothetical protein [Streptomyces silaceus]